LLAEAEKLLALNEKLLLGSNENKRPRNEEAILDRMVTMMTKAGYEPKLNKHVNVIQHFAAFVQSAKLQPAAAELKGELKSWEKGTLSDNEMMLDVEKEVSQGAVDPAMLHDGETEKEAADMLEMDAATHDENAESVPLPAAAELETDQMQYEKWMGDGALDNVDGKKRRTKNCWPFCVSQPGSHPECDAKCADPCKAVSEKHGLTPDKVCAKCEKSGKLAPGADETAHRSAESDLHAQCYPGALNFNESPAGEDLWDKEPAE
jgi:hypothetical protein